MKATCIVGSARSHGSTAYLIDTIIQGMQETGITTKKYCIGEETIHYCLGCKKCYSDGLCVQKDDVHKIVSDILDSDYVVMAAPSYWADVPGQLKTFFDRNTPYGDTNPNRLLQAQKEIKGVAIALRAGVRQQENKLILNAIQHYFGHLGIDTVKRISICETDSLDDLLEKHQKEIAEVYELGKKLPKL
ncbi:MAG: flavodoxin family protein [Faecousia sp.]